MPLVPGTRPGPYEIVAPLGAGGMGAVYRATDSRLGREVAVKILQQHLSDHPDARARFEREARAVSALNHPHICTIHDVGVHDGQPYLVMERLSGQTLVHVIGEKPLPIDRVVSLGEQIADALEVAHSAGIVHRDLKPASLFVTDRGDAKVLDFGLAQMGATDANEAATGDAPTVAAAFQTQLGTTLGTIAYMPPEQARGERLDARSDLFSLGVVLYEMATGRRPFEAKSTAEIFAAILTADPAPPSERNPEIPEELEKIILAALEKDLALRYQTATELRHDLLQVQREASGLSAASTPITMRRREKHSMGRKGAHAIAVLPFADMSPGRDQEYFSGGISEELLNLLTRIPQLQVTARTSSFSFKGKGMAISEIARQLHVTHVLEGSVRKVGNKVRITAQLIDAATDNHLWSETYDRTLDDVFAIQDEIAVDVVKQLKVRLFGAAPRVRETTPEAYPLYLHAVQLGRKRTADAFKQSDSLLRQVPEIDPRYVPAWNSLSNNLVNEVSLGLLTAEEVFPRARDAVKNALEIDPESGRADASLGVIAMFEGDLASAARHFERAVALDEAVVRRDPVNTGWLFNLASARNWAGRYDQAIVSLRTVLSLSPGYGGAHLVFGEALLGKGDASGALAEIEQETNEMFRMIGLPTAYHALGRGAAADTALAALIAKYGKETPYDIAYVCAFRGEADRAFDWLDMAAAANDPSLTLILVENLFANIRSDPRWLTFLRKLGKAPEQLATIPFRVTLPAGTHAP